MMSRPGPELAEFPELQIKYLIESGLYANQKESVRDALRSLLLRHPEYRIEVAVRAYEAGEVSLAKAGELAGLCYEEMRELLIQRGSRLKLGPETKQDALDEVRAIREALAR